MGCVCGRVSFRCLPLFGFAKAKRVKRSMILIKDSESFFLHVISPFLLVYNHESIDNSDPLLPSVATFEPMPIEKKAVSRSFILHLEEEEVEEEELPPLIVVAGVCNTTAVPAQSSALIFIG
jgi:hypothetical protein